MLLCTVWRFGEGHDCVSTVGVLQYYSTASVQPKHGFVLPLPIAVGFGCVRKSVGSRNFRVSHGGCRTDIVACDDRGFNRYVLFLDRFSLVVSDSLPKNGIIPKLIKHLTIANLLGEIKIQNFGSMTWIT